MHDLQYKQVLQPIRIGQLELKNRLVMLPMETNYTTRDGEVTERIKDYYRERARDVGLILIQITCVESSLGKGTRHR